MQHSHHSRSCMFLLHSHSHLLAQSQPRRWCLIGWGIGKCGHSWSFDRSRPWWRGKLGCTFLRRRRGYLFEFNYNPLNEHMWAKTWTPISHIVFNQHDFLSKIPKQLVKLSNINIKISNILKPFWEESNSLQASSLQPSREIPLAAHACTYEDNAAHIQSSLFSQLQLSYIQF